MDLNEINEKINQLQKEKDLLLFNENKENEEFVKKLDWLKECDGVLYYDTMSSVGTPKYRIVLRGKCPNHKKIIQVYGNRTDYYYNNIFYTSNGYSFTETNPTLSTQSEKTLIEFLKIYKLKSLEYDSSYLELLLQISKIYDSKLHVN